jgi:hypothetical protein
MIDFVGSLVGVGQGNGVEAPAILWAQTKAQGSPLRAFRQSWGSRGEAGR